MCPSEEGYPNRCNHRAAPGSRWLNEIVFAKARLMEPVRLGNANVAARAIFDVETFDRLVPEFDHEQPQERSPKASHGAQLLGAR